LPEGFRHAGVIHDAGLRHPQAGYAGDMGLALANLFGRQPFQALEPVGQPPLRESFQGGDFIRRGGHDHLAAAFMGDVVVGAEPVHGLPPLGAVARLERAGLVVESGVDHTAVVPGLVRRQPVLGLQHHQCPSGFLQQRHGGRRSDDAPADDRHVN